MAQTFFHYRDFLYLGRGINYPIALEGALKLKEISYIHAEGYAAGEMKHGPIALIDEDMPVVTIVPQDRVYDKMLSQVEQVKARGGVVIAVADEGDDFIATKADHVLWVPRIHPAAQAGADGHPAATAGLSHRRPPRRGCGSAAQPREERHGGVARRRKPRPRPDLFFFAPSRRDFRHLCRGLDVVIPPKKILYVR